MTEYNTHFDPREFGEVPEVQAALLAVPDVKKPNRPALTLVKMPENPVSANPETEKQTLAS